MVKLGKLENGVALFDFEEKIRLIIQNDNVQNILVCLDATEHDKTNPDEKWAAKDIDILRKDNPDICELLDKLYCPYFEMVTGNPNKYSVIDYRAPAKRVYLFRAVSGDKTELLYPSDDSSVDICSMLGITKCGQYGYMLTFHKSMSQQNKRSVYIRNDGGRVPDVFPLYNNCFKGIEALATVGFEEVNKEFYNSIDSNQLHNKKLSLAK